MPSSSPSTSTLPSVGPPLSGWSESATRRGGVRGKRQQKLGLWSAVALQQHFTSTGGQRGRSLPSTASPSADNEHVHGREGSSGASLDVGTVSNESDLRAHLGPSGSLAGASHKPTLAQRMGLVPPPPAAPTAEDWQVVVHRAMLREQYGTRDGTRHDGGATSSSSSSVCSICQMSFLSTSEEGQVILSCSHVFHTQCFRAFERCVRAQQRADGAAVAEVTAQLACPVCRTQHYYKRVFFEGKALTQRAAIVKMQSAIRAFLARRAYVQMRLQNNAAFRTRYVQERLARLSAAWSAFCVQQERRRETTLVALAVQHQAATAAYLTKEQWVCIWQDAMQRCGVMNGHSNIRPSTGVVIQCPICLEGIYGTYFTQHESVGEGARLEASGDDAVAALRRAYEQRRAVTKEKAVMLDSSTANSRGDGDSKKRRSNRKPEATQSTASKGKASKPVPPPQDATSATSTPPVPQLPSLSAVPPRIGTFSPGPQSGVLLSCGHCFHSACLGCYERYNEQRMTEAAGSEHGVAPFVIIADRCPICRAGYAKHPL